MKRFFIISIIIHILVLGSKDLWDRVFNKKSPSTTPLVVEFIRMPEQEKIIVDRLKTPNLETTEDAKHLSNANNKVKEESKAEFNQKESIQNANASAQKKESKQNTILNSKVVDLTKLTFKDKNLEEISNAVRLPEMNDYLPNVKDGKETLLNTKEFLFFSYYERIKKRVGMFWSPSLEEKFQKLYFSDIQLDTNADIITKLLIVLDDQGYIKEIETLAGCGVRDLDNAAIEAFTKAAPFANPPREILENDNTVILRWDFILKSENENSLRFVLSRL